MKNPEYKKIYELPHFKWEDIDSVYVGKPNKCMCGCSGKYTYTRVGQERAGRSRGYAVTNDEVNDARVQRVINRMRKYQHLGILVIDDYIYEVVIGNTQYNIYLFKSGKNPRRRSKPRPFRTTYGKAGGGSIGRLAKYHPKKKKNPDTLKSITKSKYFPWLAIGGVALAVYLFTKKQ